VNLAIVGMLHKLFYYITIKPAEILKWKMSTKSAKKATSVYMQLNSSRISIHNEATCNSL
jgi:hypothetical protein